MKRRKGIIAVIVASVGLGVAAIPAAAELHSVTVVLVTGERMQVTVDVPPGTPASQIQIPGITGTITAMIPFRLFIWSTRPPRALYALRALCAAGTTLPERGPGTARHATW